MSSQLDALSAKAEASPEVTGSIPKEVALPPERDLVFARAAASEALTRGKDTSVPWENPQTGARGTVTALASDYKQDGLVCRDFLASHVSDKAEAWMQGEACRKVAGKWEIRSLKPWRRS